MLGDGSAWGMRFIYREQPRPGGIAQAVEIAGEVFGASPLALVLGDNIFYGHGMVDLLAAAHARGRGATVFAYHVQDPERYGVVGFDTSGKATSVEEKPARPRSSYAVTGLYFYDDRATELVKRLVPSSRGELEITDLNRLYLEQGALHVEIMGRGYAWLDTGTHESLQEASNFIHAVESRQGLKVACPEEIAFRCGFIDADQVRALAKPLEKSAYGRYLLRMLDERVF
jgi:glucose-1-phosphate thymidylyltransferase